MLRKHKVGMESTRKPRKYKDRPREGRQRKPQLDTAGCIKDHAGPSASTEMKANTATTTKKKGAQQASEREARVSST